MPNKDYRFDNRTKQQFQKDIKECSHQEALIAIRIGTDICNRTNNWPKIVPIGTDYTGDFQKTGKVNSLPDYKIGKELMELSCSKTFCKKHFHWKISKVEKAIENGWNMIFVNGIGVEKEPLYIVVSPEELVSLYEKAINKHGIVGHPGHGKTFTGKEAIRIDIDSIEGKWRKLPPIDYKHIPEEYLKILEAFE